MSVGPKIVGAALAFVSLASAASAADMIANKPGVICENASSLGQLTLPTGDSKTHLPNASRADLTVAQQGGCVDILIGMRVTIVDQKNNTSVVRYTDASGMTRTMVAPNADFVVSDKSATLIGALPPGQPRLDAGPVQNRSTETSEELLRSPRLTEIIAALAYGKMTGVTPDFRAYATTTSPYRSATAFQKDAVLQNIVAGLRAQYNALSLSAVYVLHIRTPLSQYDSSRGGYPVGFNDTTSVRLSDPGMNGTTYQLTFTNINSFNFIPIPDQEKAQDFAAKYKLDTRSSDAGSFLLDVAFRLVDAPPAVDTQSDAFIRAKILAARITSYNNQVLYTFPPAPDAETPAVQSTGALKTAAIQDISVGMAEQQAIAAAKSEHPEAAVDDTSAYHAYFDDIRGSAKGLLCGNVGTPMNPPDILQGRGSSTLGGNAPAPYGSCLGFQVANGIVTAVHSTQFQAGATIEAMVQTLEAHYGPPTNKGKSQYNEYFERWVGRDPLGRAIEIQCEISRAPQGPIRLEVDAKPWTDPRPRPASVSTAGPKL